jgi:hypothetical protein
MLKGEGFRLRAPLLKIGLWTLSGAFLLAGPPLAPPAQAQAADPSQNPGKIVQDASWNELHPTGPPHPFRYRLLKIDSKARSTLKEIVETKDGDVARLLEKDGVPLTAEEDRAEIARLNNLLAHPEVQEHRRKKEHEDSTRGDEMVRMLPDAFIYTYQGIVPGPSGPCYRVTFKPNPAFAPPDREGEVYHGMEGELWIDQAQLRLARIDAHLVSDVNFGWGVLGTLYKGGNILVDDADVGMGHWETLHMKLHLQGKILMMKAVDFSTTEDASDFHPVPPEMGYQDAVRLLLQGAGSDETKK